MRTLLITHDVFAEHDTGRHHPERPARLQAALAGVRRSPGTVVELEALEIDRELLALVHDPRYIGAVERFCLAGGGALDPDTVAVPASWEAALRAAGAGRLAVDRLRAGEADCAFLVVRPPGHHAEPARAMGFCLFNNVAVTATEVMEAGERVAVVDWDVHHGNGTEIMFRDSTDLLYLSFHQFPFYPGTGRLDDHGLGDAEGCNINIPLPAGSAGDVYRRGFRELVIPVLRRFAPDWIFVSAGYDAHAADPLADLRLLPSDYSRMAAALTEVVPASRLVFFLEGGYDLDAIEASVAATLAGVAGEPVADEQTRYHSPEAAHDVIDEATLLARHFWELP